MELIVSDIEEILKVVEALSSTTRVNILKLTSREPKSVTELSEELRMTKGNVSSQVSLLEGAGLLEVTYTGGVKGLRKLVKSKYDKIIISL